MCGLVCFSLSFVHTVCPSFPLLPSASVRTQIAYSASSPDEEAMVIGACDMGFSLRRRHGDTVEVVIDDELHEYVVLNINEFTSSRKRMSVVLRCPDGQILLLCKGAVCVRDRPRLDTEKRGAFMGVWACSAGPATAQVHRTTRMFISPPTLLRRGLLADTLAHGQATSSP